MEAKQIGLLKQNQFSSFDINIIDSKSHIKNEIQCIFLMNSNYNNKVMDIRLGTDVTLYIIDMKR
jgi:membrane protein involved in colicin uptake